MVSTLTRPCPPACALPCPASHQRPHLGHNRSPWGPHLAPLPSTFPNQPGPSSPWVDTALPQQPLPPPLPHSECGHKGWPPVVAPQAALSPSLVVLPKRSGLLRAQSPADHESPPIPPSPRLPRGSPYRRVHLSWAPHTPYSALCCLSGSFPLHIP